MLHVTPLAAGYHENAASYQAAHLFPFESFWNSQDGYTVTGWPNIASEYALTALHYIALNLFRVDVANPTFGNVTAIFAPSFCIDS